MFFVTNAKSLMAIKSNLDTLDPVTWVPRVVDDATLKLAHAMFNFPKAIQDNKDTVFDFLEHKDAKQVKFVLVDQNAALPKKPAVDTIFIQKGNNGQLNYCYVSYDGNVNSGTKPEKYLGAHKDHYANPEYFAANLNETKVKYGNNDEKPLAELFYRASQFAENTQRGATVQTIAEMRGSVMQVIANAEAEAKAVAQPSFGKK